jgi:serine/threonine protein kinase
MSVEHRAERRLGPYRIVREIGRGGMGIVFEAIDDSVGRTVALKVLPRAASRDAAFVKRFHREAAVGIRLRHPNIAEIYSTGLSDGHAYIVMEKIEGKSLSAIIKEQNTLSIKTALGILEQVAAGLQEAHKHGVVHRDIKPHNIMIEPSGRVRVLDFGLAGAAQGMTELTHTGALLGTPAYMSPEQCRGERVTTTTDIYSLGVTAYQMLSGQLPFDASSPVALMYKVLNDRMPTLEYVNESIPTHLSEVVGRMMQRAANQRYQSLDEFLDDIARIRGGRPPKHLETNFLPVIDYVDAYLNDYDASDSAGSPRRVRRFNLMSVFDVPLDALAAVLYLLGRIASAPVPDKLRLAMRDALWVSLAVAAVYLAYRLFFLVYMAPVLF